jgi:hypothetical protein
VANAASCKVGKDVVASLGRDKAVVPSNNEAAAANCNLNTLPMENCTELPPAVKGRAPEC